MTAAPADSFVDSVGVNVHSFYGENNPANAYGNPAWFGCLDYLGVRYVRDNCALGPNSSGVTHRAALAEYQARGIRWLYVLAPGQVDELVASDYPEPFAVETHNEWDNADPVNFAAVLRAAQPDLYAKAKARWPEVTVLGPAVANTTQGPVVGDLRPNLDAVNIHIYRGPARTPEIDGFYPYAAADRETGATGPGLSRWITESGRANGTDAASWVPLLAAAKVLPRMAMLAFSLGIKRWFSYELLDQYDPIVHTASPQEDRFGLFFYDCTPKPAATSMRNLIALLSDPGPDFTPENLNSDVTFSGVITELHTQLFQKRDGSWWLAFWQASAVTTHPAGNGSPQPGGADMPDVNRPVTFAFGRQFGTVELYRPLNGQTVTATFTDTASVTVSSQADVQLLRLIA